MSNNFLKPIIQIIDNYSNNCLLLSIIHFWIFWRLFDYSNNWEILNYSSIIRNNWQLFQIIVNYWQYIRTLPFLIGPHLLWSNPIFWDLSSLFFFLTLLLLSFPTFLWSNPPFVLKLHLLWYDPSFLTIPCIIVIIVKGNWEKNGIRGPQLAAGEWGLRFRFRLHECSMQ